MPGGFAGVDVFFVISGFLMTGIIFRGLELEKFSLPRFYLARANRIFPPLVLLCVVLFVFGWFFLTPLTYKTLGKHIFSSVSFLSNIIYWRESGYFAASSYEKWLLHTWSLSVEWQFYIIYPLVLVIMKHFMSIRTMKFVVLFGAIIGFAFSVYVTYKWPNPAYFLLPTRAWEMMMGGVAFLFPMPLNKTNKIKLEIAAIFLIVLSYFFVSEESAWPGYLALLPVMGAFLLIQSKRNNSYVTNNYLFKKIGLWSYSIYLWHWPVVVSIRYFSLPEIMTYIGIFSSVILGALSYNYIEKFRFRSDFKSVSDFLSSRLSLMVIIVISFSGFIFISNGVMYRMSLKQQNLIANLSEAVGDWNYPFPNLYKYGMSFRYIDSNSTSNVLFLGDSLIEQYYTAVEEQNNQDHNIWFLTQGGCIPVEGFRRRSTNCVNMDNLPKLLSSISFDKIVLSGSWPDYLSEDSNELFEINNKRYSLSSKIGRDYINDGIDSLFMALTDNSKEVYFLLPAPSGEMFDPKEIDRNVSRNDFSFLNGYRKKTFEVKDQDYRSFISKKSLKFGFNIIDPLDYLCTKEKCYVVDDYGNPFYKDDLHLRPMYALKQATYIRDILG